MNKPFIISIGVAVLAALLSYTAFNYGYNTAAHKYLLEEQKRQQEVQVALNNLHASLGKVVDTVSASEQASEADLKEILARLKKSPVTIVKNGKCTPAPTFLNSIDDAVNRANSK